MTTDRKSELFSFLALLNAYIPEATLLMSECQKILGPPDPIHGGPPFEKRMEPFITCINTRLSPGRVCMINSDSAQVAVEYLANIGISRSDIANKFMVSFCGDQAQPHIVEYIKDLLTKRKIGVRGKEKFSRLIEDIRMEENFFNALSVLKTASDKFRQNQIYPQAISRLYYTQRGEVNYGKAEEWAKKSIERAPNSSYAADTLGQVYKNRLIRKARQLEDILQMADPAFRAFKDVERKADNEEGLEMKDTAGTLSVSNTFNNRGRFGFIQVAKIALEKLKAVRPYPAQELECFIQNLKMEVEDKFDFFEWYVTYSNAGLKSVEPFYFWKDIALCYELYTTNTAANSTSFPGLLDMLNHGRFTSRGKRVGFEEAEETVSDLEEIQEDLKTTYEANVDDVKVAERYILSNIILSNKMHNSPKLTPVKELQAIIQRFLGTEVGRRSPEFYLLVLLLFWPEEQPQVVQEEDSEEDEQQATEEEIILEDEDSDEEEETNAECEQLSLDLMFYSDLQQHVTFMEKMFERTEYAKYLRGRYLLPLFFLGKGSGLSKWIHKSKLDAIVQEKVDAELGGRNKKKWKRINEMWINGDVWQLPEIQDILLPVQEELCHSPMMPQEHVFVFAGGKKIMDITNIKPNASVERPTMPLYLGFTIQGPVIYNC